MKAFNREFAKMIVENSTAFSLNQIEYCLSKIDLEIWSTEHREFYATEIVSFFPSCFSTYFEYSSIKEKVVLRVF
jgi:hypothetical protein